MSYGKHQGGGSEQNPEHEESVLSRHRCVPEIASRDASNPENIRQRNTNRNVLREAVGGVAERNPEHEESVPSRHRCVPKIAFRETQQPKSTTALQSH